jgi:hypothetical protein
MNKKVVVGFLLLLLVLVVGLLVLVVGLLLWRPWAPRPTTMPQPPTATEAAPQPTATLAPTAQAGGWQKIDTSQLPPAQGYPGWISTVGDDRVLDKQAFDLTLYENQVALFQGTKFDATAIGGPDIDRCYVALIVGPVNWVMGELSVGDSSADWHQTTDGFNLLVWLAQKVQDVASAYSGKDSNCSLENIQVWVFSP